MKPQPPPSLLLGLEPVQSCLVDARVMSEQKVPRSVEQRIPILLLEYVVNFSGRDVFSNEEFDHNALFHVPRYLLFAHHSSNSQTGLNRFQPEQEGGWRLWLHSLKVAQLLRSAACLHTNQSRSYLYHLVVSHSEKFKFTDVNK